ncbi:hypothetical protein [Pararhizobium sp. DWP1-1-3]|uniref:hypothetical protein n=1 Tax=Pararhizobium sp. DWP1-1-3 TaxID=2804652 RepID=UPI003CF7F4B9
MRWRSSGWAYATLLAGQTAAAAALFVIVFPLFRQIVTHLGERQELSLSQQALIMTIAAVLHVLYWARLKWVAVVAPFHNVFAAHLCSFASRVSFFFGGALFSALFFRHLPEIDALLPVGQTLIRTVYVLVVLFGLFCYSQELDRLAKALEDPASEIKQQDL